MEQELFIDCQTGNILIGDLALLKPHERRDSVEPVIQGLMESSLDHNNGYEWLILNGVAFGGQSAGLSLCFYNGQLEEVHWSVNLPDAPSEGGWPTRDAIDDEISFVRRVLAKEMKIRIGETRWGKVWSCFDPKGFFAANGLRYHSPLFTKWPTTG